jgi:hypothetical protein
VESGLKNPVTAAMLNADLAPTREKLQAAIYDSLGFTLFPIGLRFGRGCRSATPA